MTISKPTVGAVGWNTAVDSVIDAVNALGGSNRPVIYADAPPTGLTAIAANGSTNDATALQAQLDYAYSTWGGGRVVVSKPGATVKLNTGLTIPAKVQLVSDEYTLLDFSGMSSGTAITVSDSNFTPLVGVRMQGSMTSPTTSNYSSTYTGVKVTGHGLQFDKVHIKYFGRGIDLATSNTWAVAFNNGLVENCAIGAYIDHETASTSNSGEELVFDKTHIVNSVRCFTATGNGTDVHFSHLSMDFPSGDVGKISNAQVYVEGCHIECGAIAYIFDVTGNSQFHCSSTRYTLSQSLLFKTFQGPSNYGFGKARFDQCEVYYTDASSVNRNVCSEHVLSWPSTTTSATVSVPFPIKGWCMVDVQFVNLDGDAIPNNDKPLISSRDDLNGTLTITSPSYAGQRWVKLKF